jgi:hypothetical protein
MQLSRLSDKMLFQSVLRQKRFPREHRPLTLLPKESTFKPNQFEAAAVSGSLTLGRCGTRTPLRIRTDNEFPSEHTGYSGLRASRVRLPTAPPKVTSWWACRGLPSPTLVPPLCVRRGCKGAANTFTERKLRYALLSFSQGPQISRKACELMISQTYNSVVRFKTTQRLNGASPPL